MRRITKDLTDIRTGDYISISAGPKESKKFSASGEVEIVYDMYVWQATIIGPDDTPYAGGIFTLEVAFPADYPFKPPHVQFLTPIFHPNINDKGSICLDILKDKWSPSLTVGKVLVSICSLLNDPNPNDPLNGEAAELMLRNRDQFNLKAKEITSRIV